MSIDRQATEDLMEVLENGIAGYALGAGHLDRHDHDELVATFRRYGEQRSQFVTQLRGLADIYGDDINASDGVGGSVAGRLHRSWLALRDLVSGADPTPVLTIAIQGEDHAIEAYDAVLAEQLSDDLRSLVDLQLDEIRLARAELDRAVRALAG